jgi:exodeoxyribonuclease V alpha subunit
MTAAVAPEVATRLLAPCCEAGVISTADLAAARVLVELARKEKEKGTAVEPSLLAWIGMCLALRTPRDGHTCVDLSQISEWAGPLDLEATTAPAWPMDPGPWIEALTALPALVGEPGSRTPFILDRTSAKHPRLYLARALAEEQAIAASLLHEGSARIGILLGGPGSGKTYTLAKDLIARIEEAEKSPLIALAAPTGKAAARMKQSLEKRCAHANASQKVLDTVHATTASTVHRLLGYNPSRTPQFAHGPDSTLDFDLVVIDEVSMMSSSLMQRLLSALGPRTEIRLVGDPDQLASVESGTVLADIAEACADPACQLHARMQKLTGQHRYKEGSMIARLATAIRAGDANATIAALGAGADDVTWIKPGDRKRLEETFSLVADHARGLRERARNIAGEPDEHARRVLEKQAQLQVICANRTGPMGVAGWNQRIEKRLGIGPVPGWYSGRPVMVTINNPDINLYNGDVGVVVPAENEPGDASGQRRKDAVFPLGDEIIRVPVTRLEDVDTVHALTIHKSQGSEYDHAIVVLPARKSLLLTRELLFTGVTRAAKQVTVIGSEEVIRAGVERKVRRATGLADRLRKADQGR